MTAFFTELFNQRGDPGVNSHELAAHEPQKPPGLFPARLSYTDTHDLT